MQRKYFLKTSIILLLIAGSFIALWSFSVKSTGQKAATESIDECCNKHTASGEMIWETLSHQFFSTTEFSN